MKSTRRVWLPYRDDEESEGSVSEQRVRAGRAILNLCDGDRVRAEKWLLRSGYTPREIASVLARSQQNCRMSDNSL